MTPPTAAEMTGDSPRSTRRVHAMLAAVAWLPLLSTARGQVAADTRQHIYLDPGEFLGRARSLWDPMVHLGTVTHQNLGLISPMGWWFWVVDAVGLPMWLGQRLWLGAIVFAAGAGVLHLGRTLGWPLPGTTASAFVFAFSPYLLQYGTRTSVLLLPFCGLPWLLSFTIRAVRSGRWGDAAACGLVVFLVGSVNATSLILVGLAPVLWIAHTVTTRTETAARALAAAARIGVVCLATSAWWMVALAVQSRHGLPVLTYTETLDQVAVTSSATEVLRGLGYWVFYGREVLDPNVGAAVAYTQNPALLALTYGLPLLGLASAVLVRFRQRGYFVLLLVTGVVVAVGAFPPDDPSLGGELFRGAADTTAGLALRSSTRAVPLVVLALAVFIGRGVDTLGSAGTARWATAGGVVAASLLALPALWTGGFVDPNFARPSDLPDHWEAVADRLHGDGPLDGAVLEIPGIQFATYRWGTTYEPVTPGLIDRPVVAREQLPYGSAPSADLLIALDRRIQEGVTEAEAIAPVARLMAADHVLLRNDLAFERYVSARPRRLWNDLLPLPDGLERAGSFGDPARNTPDPRLPLLDEEALRLGDAEDPAPIELLSITDPSSRLRTSPASGPLVLIGDGEGIVDAAAADLLPDDGVVLYGASLLADPALHDATFGDDPSLVVTDTNRRRERRWRSVRWSTGHTQRADEIVPDSDLGDGDLAVFEHPGTDAQTTMVHQGATVDASSYGGPFTLDPDGRPALALDGRDDTGWVVGPFVDARGQSISVRPDRPVRAPISLSQRDNGNRITEIEVSVNDGPGQRVTLDERSIAGGQTIEAGDAPIETLTIEILSTAIEGASDHPVELTEIDLGGLVVSEIVRLPTALVDSLDTTQQGAPTTYVMTRLRADPSEPVRADEESALKRRFRAAADRRFEVTGTVRLAGDGDLTSLAALLGIEDSISSSSALPGDLRSNATAAFDGDEATAWRPAFLDLEGSWIEARVPEPVPIDELVVTIVDDGDHSVPTAFELSVDGVVQHLEVPPSEGTAGGRRVLRLPVEAAEGRVFRLAVASVEPRVTTDYYSRGPIATPVGIAEVELPGVPDQRPTSTIDTGCRDDLLMVDGRAVPVRIQGSTEAALDGRELRLTGCADLPLASGDHDLEAVSSADTSLDLDRVVLASVDRDPTPSPDAVTPTLSDVEVTSPTRYAAAMGPGGDSWVVLAQSNESGWHLRVDGEDQGPPILVDGGFNGWRVPASGHARNITVEWTPQRIVDRAVLVSAIAVLLALGAFAAGVRRPTVPAAVDVPAIGLPLPAPRRIPSATIGLVAASSTLGLLTLDAIGLVIGALAAALALGTAGGRRWIGAGVVATWALAGAWVVAGQVVDPRRPDFEWAAGLVWPNRLALLAVLLLAVTTITGPRAGIRESVR